MKTSTKTQTTWMTVIWRPDFQQSEQSTAASLLNPEVPKRTCSYPLMIMLPPEPVGVQNPDMPMHLECRSIILRPGANLNVCVADWQSHEGSSGHSLTIFRMESGALKLVYPIEDHPDPGYRSYDEQTAISLIGSTLHEDWINEWLAGEKRTSVLEAGERQIAELIRIKQEMRQR